MVTLSQILVCLKSAPCLEWLGKCRYKQQHPLARVLLCLAERTGLAHIPRAADALASASLRFPSRAAQAAHSAPVDVPASGQS